MLFRSEYDAIRQDIRPLRIGLLNLMPNKIPTETQIARLIGATPLQVELTLVRITSHQPRNTAADHMAAFYRPWEDVRAEKFDGFIITGAPVEKLPFEEVLYWDELQRILDWTQSHVHRTLTICWAAQAALHHFHGLAKYELPEKAFGVFPHRRLVSDSPFLRGFSDNFPVPVSRWTEMRRPEIDAQDQLTVLAASEATGPCLVDDPCHAMLHIFNHLEYDTATLGDEYFRDQSAGLPTLPPAGYFPEDDTALAPCNNWRAHAHLLFANWIAEIYRTTPFQMEQIGEGRELGREDSTS